MWASSMRVKKSAKEEEPKPSWLEEGKAGQDNKAANEAKEEEEENTEATTPQDKALEVTETTPLVVDDKNNNKKQDKVVVTLTKPRPNACLILFNLLGVIGAIASLGLLVTQIVPLFFVKKVNILQYALRVYVSLFCLCFLCLELDVALPFLRTSTFLQNFMPKGFLYSFVGLVGLEEAQAIRVADALNPKGDLGDELRAYWAAVVIDVASWMVVGTGVIYFLLGACFMKRVRDRIRTEHREEVRQYKRAVAAGEKQ